MPAPIRIDSPIRQHGAFSHGIGTPFPIPNKRIFFSYLWPYYNLPLADQRTIAESLSCPGLPDEARKNIRTANFVRRNGPFGTASADQPWGATTDAEVGKPFWEMGYARQSPNQPPLISNLSDKARWLIG